MNTIPYTRTKAIQTMLKAGGIRSSIRGQQDRMVQNTSAGQRRLTVEVTGRAASRRPLTTMLCTYRQTGETVWTK